jgi:zinc protease
VKRRLAILLLACSMAALLPVSVEGRLAVERSVLGNGLVLLTSEQNALPMVTFNLLLKAGSRYDPAGAEGLANLTARLLTYGTRKRTAIEISELLDFIGAELSTASGDDLATISMTLLKKHLPIGLELLTEILTESVFPAEEIERQKQQVLAAIRGKQEDPGEVAQMKFMESLYPKSPYGRPVEGTESSVRGIERGALQSFYDRYYRPNRAILAVVGDFSHGEITAALTESFKGWKEGPAVTEAPPDTTPGPADFIRVDKNITQANIVIGHEGVPRDHPDYYAIQVMNYILGGGGFTSRLMDEVRNQRGLAYSVYSVFFGEKHVGTFMINMQTKNETAGEAIRIAGEEMRRLREEGVSDEELEAAKAYLTGSFPLRLDTNRRIAGFLSHVEYFGLGLGYVEQYPDLIGAVTRQDVQRVAARYLQPEKLVVVVVANQAKAALK